ncbi:MAG TPA: polysaccharide pyruvyl transferase CsaB [Bacillota bacterium]|nr:polysaccharide pyruvyl transferase CsaB [Bacillota bacterium]HQD74033.1 polysaccharide pyruvyl transferase CsaB [Bacillota bacterium]
MGNVLLSGYYGFGNIGDEAILTSTINALRKARPDLNLIVLSQHPDETSHTYNVESYHRMSITEVTKAMKKSDLVIFGGGSLLQDATSFRSLLYYLSIINLAHIYKKPVIVYANGIGPIRSRLGRVLTKRALETVEAITVRDAESRDELIEMGVTKDIEVTADPAFLLEPSPDYVVDEILQSHGLDSKTDIVWIALRDINAPDWFHGQIKTLISTLREQGLSPCFLAMQSKDLKLTNALNQELAEMDQDPLPVISNISPEETLGILELGQFCLGMRLHTLILSAKAGIPFMGVYIDPKIGAFCRSTGLPQLPYPQKEPNFDLVEEFSALMENADTYKNILNEKLSILSSLAQQNIDIVLSHLDKVCP